MQMMRFPLKFFSEELLSAFGTLFKVVSRGALFSLGAPTFVSLCMSSNAEASGFDFNLGGTFRSYPLSGVLEAEAGYGVLLWGREGGPWYGYLRPKLEGATAGTYNSGAMALEFFPISFLGARAGGESIQNDKEYTAYDCDLYGCRGRFARTFVETELTLGAGPVFVQGRWRRERWTQKNADAGDFIEPTSGIALRGTGDSETVYIGVAGFKLNDAWSVFGVVRYAESDESEGWSRLPYGVLRYTRGRLQVGAGAGQFESNLKEKDTTALAFLKWEIRPSIALK